MRISTMTASGIKFTFSTKEMPITSALKNLIAGKQVVKPTSLTFSLLTITKKIALTRGESSSHCSCKKRFAFPLSYEEENGRDKRHICKWNDGRKPKTFSRATIRGTSFLFLK